MDEIKISIFSGEWRPGERLPAVRVFAAEKKVNPNTLQRALAELEREGLLYTERTNGKFVTRDEGTIAAARVAYAERLTAEYVTKMQQINMEPGEPKITK